MAAFSGSINFPRFVHELVSHKFSEAAVQQPTDQKTPLISLLIRSGLILGIRIKPSEYTFAVLSNEMEVYSQVVRKKLKLRF